MSLDREKVIKGLECCTNINMKCEEEKCPYWKNDDCSDDLMRDALSLLKEHEAVEPRRDANCVRMFRCGACGEYVGFIDSDPGDPNEQDNYCRNCGRKVKWDGNYKAMR